MSLTLRLTVVLLSVSTAFPADVTNSMVSDAYMREKLFQRFLAESQKADKESNRSELNDQSYTNVMRLIFDGLIVHPSFGYRWDEVPAPTMTSSNGIAAVDAFVAKNGWDMQKDGFVFSVLAPDKSKAIRGLPWTAIHDREFPAVTHDGILYVFFKGWHHNNQGVAYNPKTNAFVRGMAAFKPVGQHWYVWKTTDDLSIGPQQYEGTK